jgi:hypothetical protein
MEKYKQTPSNDHSLEVLGVLGPLGAGKTTTLNQLIERVPLDTSYAVVVNDVGQDNVDARRIAQHPANRSEQIIPLTAGCIGCSDATQFQAALDRVRDAGVDMLFIEPTGIAPGTEIAEVVSSSGYDFSALALVNARTASRDMHYQVLPSQLAVADIVGITHAPDDRTALTVIDSVLEQLPVLPPEVAVELIRPGSTDYAEVLARLRGVERQLHLGQRAVAQVCGSHCHDHHHHSHSHCDHDHNVSAQSFALRGDVTSAQLHDFLMPLTQDSSAPLLRAKGVAAGKRFDLVGDEWNEQPEPEGAPRINVIFGGHMPQHVATTMQAFVCQEAMTVQGTKKDIVASVRELPLADRIAIIEQRVQQYPAPISPVHGELITDCEADEGYEIAFWRQSDDIPDNIKRQALEHYLTFRLAGLNELQTHPEAIAHDDKKRAYWQRRYGATLGWNYYHLTDMINPTMQQRITAAQPAQLLCEGFMALEHLTFDEGRAEEKPEFVSAVLRAALAAEDVTSEQCQAVLRRGQLLSAQHPEYAQRWQQAAASLE